MANITIWKGWTFDGEFLVSPVGLRFTEKDIQDLLWRAIPQNEHWTGWHFYEEYLYDEAGNKYHVNDIRSVFMTRQLYSTMIGYPDHIYFLKRRLEEKVEASKPPKIEITFGDGTKKTVEY